MRVIIKGGKVLNRGFKGVVMELYNKNSEDKQTLYEDLMQITDDSTEIKLVTVKEEIKIKSKEEILKLIKKRSEKVLAKKFESSSFMFGSNYKNFNNELDAYKQLIGIFKGDISKYTTIKKGFKYKNHDVYGIIFNNNHYIFLEKCYKTLDNIQFTEKTLNKCINEIMEILNILNANNYIHNDIKPDNIILCRKRFKLIDWESSNYIKDQASTFINSKNGNLTYNHPIKFYRLGVLYPFYRYIYDAEIITYPVLDNLKKPKLITQLVESTYSQVVSKYSKLSKIVPTEEKPRQTRQTRKISEIKEDSNYFLKLADYYSFALTIIYIAERNKIDYNHKIIDKILKFYFIDIK